MSLNRHVIAGQRQGEFSLTLDLIKSIMAAFVDG